VAGTEESDKLASRPVGGQDKWCTKQELTLAI